MIFTLAQISAWQRGVPYVDTEPEIDWKSLFEALLPKTSLSVKVIVVDSYSNEVKS